MNLPLTDLLLFVLPYINGLRKTAPTIQAGHQTHQTITCVHNPLTLHPNAACISTISTPIPQYQQTAVKTTGGENVCNITLLITLIPILNTVLSGMLNLRCSAGGKARRPIRKAREKLRVARVARNMPRRRREKHFIRRRWGWVGGK